MHRSSPTSFNQTEKVALQSIILLRVVCPTVVLIYFRRQISTEISTTGQSSRRHPLNAKLAHHPSSTRRQHHQPIRLSFHTIHLFAQETILTPNSRSIRKRPNLAHSKQNMQTLLRSLRRRRLHHPCEKQPDLSTCATKCASLMLHLILGWR